MLCIAIGLDNFLQFRAHIEVVIVVVENVFEEFQNVHKNIPRP